MVKYKKFSFPYWFQHWCAFQMTALNLGCWKFRFLFHDWEKPWLKLIIKDYKKVQQIHRDYSRHHLQNDLPKDWLAIVIDWECSRFTKPNAPLNARETMEQLHPEVKEFINPLLNRLGI